MIVQRGGGVDKMINLQNSQPSRSRAVSELDEILNMLNEESVACKLFVANVYVSNT